VKSSQKIVIEETVHFFFFFFFFFSGLPHWRNGQACRIDPYPSVHEDSEEAVLAAKS
jgi:hypothetical protein